VDKRRGHKFHFDMIGILSVILNDLLEMSETVLVHAEQIHGDFLAATAHDGALNDHLDVGGEAKGYTAWRSRLKPEVGRAEQPLRLRFLIVTVMLAELT
jgi:hypothetical protein